tara:strand:- start:251 stop:523 length:273 start_codon:yes stop_codon:yes gene_type:complete
VEQRVGGEGAVGRVEQQLGLLVLCHDSEVWRERCVALPRSSIQASDFRRMKKFVYLFGAATQQCRVPPQAHARKAVKSPKQLSRKAKSTL